MRDPNRPPRLDDEPDVLYPELSDPELVELCQEGDHRAFEQIYYRYRDRLLRYTWELTGDHDVAVDSVKDTFEALFTGIEQVEPERDLLLLLYADIRDRSGGKGDEGTHRKRLEMEWDTLAGEGDWTGPSQDMDISATVKECQTVLLGMEEEVRDVFVLSVLEELKVRQISQVTGLKPSRVGEVLKEGKQTVRDKQDTDVSELADAYRNLELPPFPKGEESELFSTAREESRRIDQSEPPSEEMDPDLRQVLGLIPEIIVLLVLLILLPFIVDYFSGDEGSGERKKTPNTRKVEEGKPAPEETNDGLPEKPGTDRKDSAKEEASEGK